MKITLHLPLFLSLIVFTSCTTMNTRTKSAANVLSSESFKWKVTRSGEMPYAYYLPEDYTAKSGRRWPLMLFLHGAGERGSDAQRVAIHGPLSMVKRGTNFPFIIIAPLCPAKERWSKEALLQLLARLERRFVVDSKRVYLTGLSMGGYGTWELGLSHPERFAALAPICGGGDVINVILAKKYETNRLAAIKTLGIWAFHGAKDTVVPPEESERMVNALKRAGCNDVKLTIYPDAQHNSWTETYNNPAFYEWMLKHARK